MSLFGKRIYSLFGMNLSSETERRELALAIIGFNFLDDEISLEGSDTLGNIETKDKQKDLHNARNWAMEKKKV